LLARTWMNLNIESPSTEVARGAIPPLVSFSI
jgi:hypothetical protein